ncbi:NADPH-dependent ferric siderophore reductase, contains FAD-binding and SIP domains [Amycolatopsis sacchari]|uniref:NADPH-dependent ferric siderophore reductase, contains FAD-binding and SIP domains n=1 Tax=Amycolatopsis sacchari TaxID=115433 RepID=A0A1I3YC54_9PSEU|nr:siderophore-interacting protein [Amycolatopsis sacchari]SFK29444.1 NADPH-dependent ferric siderophore reductase, contains FAD-binding and SIP domains [Amycolatopsis sacchari]
MSLLPKRQTPETRSLVRAHVLHVERTSEHFATVTLGGPGLAAFEPLGGDQCFRLFFRREGQDALRLPTAAGNGWIVQTLLMRAEVRPWVRNYTVRSFRREPLELDVEFALHADGGPGGAFPLRARPGEEVGLFDEGRTYLPPEGARRQLLVADETAVPAALAILETAPADLAATVLLEVPAKDDVHDVSAPSGVDITWLPRDGTARPGQLALEALTANAFPQPDYAWIAGESALATGARRYLHREREVPKSAIAFFGYWRLGRSAPG